MKLRPFKKWQFNFDLKWNGYSDWNEFKIEFDRELDLLRIAKYLDSKDATSHSITLDRGYRAIPGAGPWACSTTSTTVCSYAPATNTGLRRSPRARADILVPIGDANLSTAWGWATSGDKDTVIDVGFNYFVTNRASRPIPAAT